MSAVDQGSGRYAADEIPPAPLHPDVHWRPANSHALALVKVDRNITVYRDGATNEPDFQVSKRKESKMPVKPPALTQQTKLVETYQQLIFARQNNDLLQVALLEEALNQLLDQYHNNGNNT